MDVGEVVTKGEGNHVGVSFGVGGVSLVVHIEETGHALRIWLRPSEAVSLVRLLNAAVTEYRADQKLRQE